MYCIRCGVELAPSERSCPLCGTVVYHPDLPQQTGEPTYPPRHPVRRHLKRHAPLSLLTLLTVILGAQVLMLDMRMIDGLSWSYYAVGGLLLLYVIAVLPCWFVRPNPVIFVPCDFAAVMLYTLGVDVLTGGGWFLSFAFPVIGLLGLLTTAVITLCRYVRRGYYFIWGGAIIALGAFIVLLELFIHITFSPLHAFFWSFYPLVGCTLLGMFLILVGICKPLREALEKTFFL